MKKWMTTAMIGVIACTSLAFADASVPAAKVELPQPQEKPPIVKPLGKPEVKIQLKQQSQQLKQEQKQEQKQDKKQKPDQAKIAQYRANLSKVIAQYAPELMNGFKDSWQQIDSIRAEIDKIMTELRAEKKATVKAQIEAIKANVIAGKITKAEATAQIEALKAALEAERATIKTTFDTMKAEYGLGQEQAKAIHEALRAALEAKDEAGVKAVLTQLLEHLGKRIAFLNTKLAYIEKL